MSADILIRWTSESGAAIRDMQKVNKALGDTQTAADRNARRWQAASQIMRRAAVIGLGAIATEAVRASKAAAVQEQAVGGLQAVFKKSAPQMETWAKSMSDVGLSMTEASTYAAQLGASLKGAGLEDYAAQTRKLTELGADLAATFGGTTQDAVEALGSTLRGEYDPLERYGAALKESEVSALIAKRGQDKLTGAALEQAKMAARLDLIWKKTKDAQGQAAREADTSAAAFQRLKAKLANIEADLGKALLPFMEDLAGAVGKLADAAEKNPQAVKQWAGAAVALAAGLLVLSTAAKAVTVMRGLAAGMAAIGGAAAAIPAAAIAAWVAVAVDSFRKIDKYGTKTGADAAANFWNPQPWNTAGEKVYNVIQSTMDKIKALITQKKPPVEIDAANRKALDAAAQVQKVLDTIARSKPKATINAANQQALNAAAQAEKAIKDATQARTARIDADTAKARADVLAWKAWAQAQQALITVRAQVVGGTPSTSGASRAAVLSGRSGGSTTATVAAAPTYVFNINGFTGDEDRLARRVVVALDSASGRYNSRRYSR